MAPGSRGVPFALLLAFGCAQSEPSRELYQWTDEAGGVRYTAFPDRIPRPARGSAVPVVPGATAAPNTASPPAPAPAPAATPAPEPETAASATAEGDGSAREALERRIAVLEAQVQSDQEALMALIAEPEAPELRTSPELREISERLPALQAELESLRRQLDRLENEGDGA